MEAGWWGRLVEGTDKHIHKIQQQQNEFTWGKLDTLKEHKEKKLYTVMGNTKGKL